MIPILTTRRLMLEPLTAENAVGVAAQVQTLFAHWEIVQHLNAAVPWPYPEDAALHYYRDVALPAIVRGQEWHWTLRLKSAPSQVIGGIGLTLGEINRGFWLGLPWQRQGLMSEAVVAVNDYWFNTLNQTTLRTKKAIANTTSRRVSERTGMRLIGTCESTYVSGNLPSEIWETTKEEWHLWRQQNP
jgi:RimJ/RimL family protein N-acetyltransferase